jgi:FkbM family methyltransferase
MKDVFRLLRKNKALNGVVRSLIRNARRFIDRAVVYWPVSGIVEFRAQDLSVKLYAEGDDALTSKLYYQKNWENHILLWFMFFCQRSDVIVDAGANVGLFTLLAAKVNPNAKVHAFEPNPNNIERFKINLKLNKADSRSEVHPYALGESEGIVQFYLPLQRISDVSSVFSGHTRSFNDFEHISLSVQSVSLDAFFVNRTRKIDLIKIDVELYELQVLKGMRQILQTDRPVIFCEIFNDVIKTKLNPMLKNEIGEGHTADIAALLRESGYYFYSITHDGLVEVSDFFYSPMSSMYLLVPKKLTQKHYMFNERHLIDSQF